MLCPNLTNAKLDEFRAPGRLATGATASVTLVAASPLGASRFCHRGTNLFYVYACFPFPWEILLSSKKKKKTYMTQTEAHKE